MTFNQFIAILLARWKIFVAIVIATVLTALIVSLLLPKQYTAESTVLIDFKATDPIAGYTVNSQMLTPAYMKTQIDVIESERVAARAIKNLRLDQNAQMRENWQKETGGRGSFESWLATLLSNGLTVIPSRESTVIEINYRAADPDFAAALANAYTQAYIDTTLDLRVEPAKQFSSLFDEQAKHRREQLERAQANLSEYQQANGLIATDERIDVENARLNELSSQLVAIQVASADSSSRQAAAQSRGDQLQEVLNNAVISGLKADLARYEGKLQELLSKVGEAHPQVIEARANINELRARLQAETHRVTAGVGVNNTVNKSREGQIRASLEQQRQKVLKLKEQRDQANVMLKDVENAQRAYDAVLARVSQSSLESQANQTNVAILKRASAPTDPTHPKVFLNTALAAVMGVVLGLATILAVEMTDRRLRTEDDIAGALNAVVLGTLPSLSKSTASTSGPMALASPAKAGLLGMSAKS